MSGSGPLPAPAYRSIGINPRTIDSTLARINRDSYNERGTTVDGWTPLHDEDLIQLGIKPSMMSDTHTGFSARLYTKDGDYVVVFRGTNEGSDWPQNLRQGLGLRSKQYEQALLLGNRVDEALGGRVIFTGHSLGGGLASLAALHTKNPAVTFNAAGLHDNTLERLNLNTEEVRSAANNGLIRAYSVDNEILTTLQERNLLTRGLLPDAVGHKIELPDPEPLRGWRRLVPGSGLVHGLELHGMDAVLRAQELAERGSMAQAAHPANAMFEQALRGLRRIDATTLGFDGDHDYRNAAGVLVARAREGGMQRIDHVVLGTRGAVFAVEGGLHDPDRRIAKMDKDEGAAQSLELSSRQAALAGAGSAQQSEQQRRAVLTP